MTTGEDSLEPGIVVRAVPDAAIANALFQRRYRQDAPDFPHHVVAFWRNDGEDIPVCYIHFTEQGRALLGGGACVDDRAMRRMPASLRNAIRDAGGLYKYALGWSMRHFAPHCDAIFGYCGDALAERVDLALGFAKTQHRHLLAFWTRELTPARQQDLIGRAHAVGAF
jgi:hypothetical protein